MNSKAFLGTIIWIIILFIVISAGLFLYNFFNSDKDKIGTLNTTNNQDEENYQNSGSETIYFNSSG